ncbi:MAG: hypothetical protein HQ546_06285 [Planctomycetes bacterium]|nr:hypothetical protein [Planctomycetota bacterium]
MNTEETSPSPVKGRADRYVKGAFLLVVLAVVGWAVVRQYTDRGLKGWGSDLSGALVKATQQNQKVVALIYDNKADDDYQRMVSITLDRDGNKKALDEAGFIRVCARLSRDNPLAIKYNLRKYPTTLLIGPGGELITSWTGYIGELDFRKKFLKGQPQP